MRWMMCDARGPVKRNGKSLVAALTPTVVHRDINGDGEDVERIERQYDETNEKCKVRRLMILGSARECIFVHFIFIVSHFTAK